MKLRQSFIRNISNTRNCVSRDIQTPRRELKIRRAAGCFDEIPGVKIADETLSQMFDISAQSEQKLESERRSKIVTIYANKDRVSKPPPWL